MLFNVPQFIEIEDKIVGPLTAKQLGWMAVAGVLMLISFSMLDTSAFIVMAIIILTIFGSLAFYRPYNQPLLTFLMSSVGFIYKPKVYVWKRTFDNMSISKSSQKKKEVVIPKKKTLDQRKIEEISKILNK